MLEADVDNFFGRAFPAYEDTNVDVADRTWAYLHSNCSGCHRPGAPGNQRRSATPDLRYDLFAETSSAHPLEARLCNIEAGAGDLRLGPGAQIVVPGLPGDWENLSAGGSVLYLRMSARADVPGSTGTMPLIGSKALDDVNGLPLVSEWLGALSCE